jgi:choline dehydrogenase-like flavoprotein
VAERYDFLIVGGGTAGCVLAGRLSENRERRVCLVEAGHDYGPYADGGWPDELLDARALTFTHDWGTGGEDDRSLGARVVGGCSTHNACLVLQGTPADYDEWGPEWEHTTLAPYLARASATLRTASANTDRPAPLHTAFVAAAQEVGFHLLADPNDPAQVIGVAPLPANVVGRVRWNAAFAYLDPARARPNLTILGDALVDRLLVSGSRATGALLADGRQLEADAVVLTAGAYFTPAILLRSGIGSEDELRRHSIPVVVSLPVGERLLDHCGSGIAWEPSETLQELTAAHVRETGGLFEPNTVLKASSSACPQGSWDIHLLPWTNPVKGARDRFEMSCGCFHMKPLSAGRVRLRSTDPWELPDVQRGFLTQSDDAQVIVEALELARAIAAAEPLRGLLADELQPADRKLEEYVRATVRNYFHPAGTCAIGDVTDTHGRVLGAEALIIADASLMPTIPRANTNLTTLAIADRIADALV